MPTIVHFDIASDDPVRAKNFYETLFNWKMFNPAGMEDFFLITTEDSQGQPGVGGGLGKRGDPAQKITLYIGVEAIEPYLGKIEELGGKVVQPKTTVPGWGYMASGMDTEGNIFGLWQDDSGAGQE